MPFRNTSGVSLRIFLGLGSFSSAEGGLTLPLYVCEDPKCVLELLTLLQDEEFCVSEGLKVQIFTNSSLLDNPFQPEAHVYSLHYPRLLRHNLAFGKLPVVA